ncbi:MAG: ArsR/SmtB family transcription factor [Acidobacteriaceae bacterium]
MKNKKHPGASCPASAALQEVDDLRPVEGPDADKELAAFAKAMGHPVRVRILRMLSRREARVCSEIVNELPLAQSTVSEHLRILKGAGLVRASCSGTKAGYCIEAANLRRMKALVAIL